MKKINYVSMFAILMLFAFGISGWAAEAPYIAPINDQTATLGEVFTYDVNAINADPAESYQLLSGRPGMTIDPSTGVITWTPTGTGDGGAVSVRAYNNVGESVRTFVVYISDAIVCADNLISYWKLDEPSGDVYEDFTGGYTATSLTSLTNVVGKVENGKTFTPLGKTDQFIYVTDEGQYDFQRSGGFSVSLWFKYDGQPFGEDNNQVIIGRGSPELYDEMLYLIMVDVSSGSPVINFSLRPKSADEDIKAVKSDVISSGQWYHVVAVYEGAAPGLACNLRLYLNNSMKWAPHIFGNVDFIGDGRFDMNIGYWDRYEANRYPFSGSMDEILVYDKALSSSEVSAIYSDGIAGKPHCKPGNYYPLFSTVPVTAAAQDVEYSYTVEASDFNNDPITLTGVTIPSWLTFSAVTGLLTGTPDNTNTGDHAVSIKASDGSIEIFQNFTINVTNTNDPPVFTSTPLTEAMEGEAYTAFVTADDPDGDVLVFTTPILPSWLTFDPGTKALIGIPSRANAGDNPVHIIVSDGVFQISQEFVIVVGSNNNTPVITTIAITSVDNYSLYEYTISAFDADPTDVLTFSAEIIPAWASFDPVTHMLSGTPEKQFVGIHPVTLVVSDGWVEVKQEFTIEVRDVNTPPIIHSVPNDTARVGELYAYLVDVTDNDGDIITLEGLIIPPWMTFNAASRVLSGTPTTDYIGPNNVMITAFDGTVTVNQLFTITVVNALGINFTNKLVASVYPNPAQDYIIFAFDEQATTIEITDLSGKILVHETIDSGDFKVQLDISDLHDGMYMYRVFDETRSQYQTGKFVIN